ncbi:MAG: cytochrome P450, partial [Kordiimonadaceae bacterium]|nr:cytochrome P450 [Kordiimonadaceae bacterium]
MSAPSQPSTEYVVPDHVPPELVVPFDHQIPECTVEEMFQRFADLHKGPDIIFSPLHGGFWVASKADAIREIMETPALFSSYPASIPAMVGRPRKMIPVELDGAQHASYRKLFNPSFTPKKLSTLSDQVMEETTRILDQIQADGKCEFASEFARLLPGKIFIKMLGLPVADTEKFLDWSLAFFRATGGPARQEAAMTILQYLGKVLQERAQKEPTDDFIGMLQSGEIDGKPLSFEEQIDTCFLLFIAGLDTVAQALSFSIYYLGTHPE